jgi:hypothetical protein
MKSARALIDAADRSGATYIEYFGDLDPAGLNIPVVINQELRFFGKPEVLPAGDLYRRLLTEGKRRPLTTAKRQQAGAAIHWLPNDLVSQVQELFEEGMWLPQEGLRLSCTAQAPA